jgi:hypothetical protein
VTPFNVGRLPPGIVAPRGLTTVYAVALEVKRGERCKECKGSGTDPYFVVPSAGCVCAH